MADIVNRIADCFAVIVDFMTQPQAVFFQQIAIPVDRFAGMLSPNLKQALIAVTVGLSLHFRHHVEWIRIVVVFDLLPGVHGCQRIANS